MLQLKVASGKFVSLSKSIIKVGVSPFGLTMTPNISLIIINRFSIFYGGDQAVAVYACIAYIICIVYLIFQGVGDGSQPIISRYYGEKDLIGVLFGSSAEVNARIAEILPIFLISVPFVAVTRVTTASFYATEESILSYILTYIEPVLMLILMFTLPPLFGGQIMIWWSTVIARILAAILALILKQTVYRRKLAG